MSNAQTLRDLGAHAGRQATDAALRAEALTDDTLEGLQVIVMATCCMVALACSRLEQLSGGTVTRQQAVASFTEWMQRQMEENDNGREHENG